MAVLEAMTFAFFLILTSDYNISVIGDPQVIGSSKPVLVNVGEDVTLPCHIWPPVDVDNMTVEWSRPDLKPEDVHIHQQGRTIDGVLNPLYEQRTSLFAEELRRGNISLKLSKVQHSDEGTFKCFVPSLRSQQRNRIKRSSLIQLLVGAVSQPVISVNGPIDDSLAHLDISLTCDSGCWYPQPEVSWLDSEGNNLTAGSSETVSHSHSCYVVRRNVTVRRAGNVTCRVHQPHINHTVEIYHVIPEIEIPTVHGRGRAAGITTGVVIPVFVVLVAVMRTKRKQTETETCDSEQSPAGDRETTRRIGCRCRVNCIWPAVVLN